MANSNNSFSFSFNNNSQDSSYSIESENPNSEDELIFNENIEFKEIINGNKDILFLSKAKEVKINKLYRNFAIIWR